MEITASDQRKVLIATSVSYVVVTLDTSVVNVAVKPIASTLTADVAGLQWVISAYTLAFASLLLTGGVLGDRFGAKKIYAVGLLVFGLASVICGLATALPELIAARVVQGIGAALLVPCSLALLKSAFAEPAQRARVIGVWAGCGGIAIAAGPLAGGLLIEWLGWRSIFWLNVPIVMIGIWLTSRTSDTPPLAPNRHLDISGQLLAIIALATSVGVLIEGAKLGWSSTGVIVGGLLACVAWSALVIVERRQPEPMLALHYFSQPVFTAVSLLSMISALIFYGLFFLLSLYFQTSWDWSPLETGLAFLPLTLMVTVGSFSCSRLSKAYGERWVLCAGFLLYALGLAGLFALVGDSPYWRIALCYPALGFAAGIITPATTSALMNLVNEERAGTAAGLLNASRQSGSALGVALFGALLTGVVPLNAAIEAAITLSIGLSLIALVVAVRLMRPPISAEVGRNECQQPD